MGRRGLVVLLAAAICLGLVPSLGAVPTSPPRSGPVRGATLIEGQKGRVYSLPGEEPPYSERVYGCLTRGGSHPWRLSPPGRKRGLRLTETAFLNAPWAGGEMRFSGVDTYALSVTARNLRTGLSNECEVGHGGFPRRATPPSLKKAVVSPSGTIAWSGYGIIKKTERLEEGPRYVSTTPLDFAPGESGDEIVECLAGNRVVLDSGYDLDLTSLKLRGTTLSWTNAGERMTAQLP